MGVLVLQLSDGSIDSKLAAEVVSTKGLVSGLVKGLNEDDPAFVRLVLEHLWRVTSDRRVALDARRAMWDEGAVSDLVKLYDVEGSTREMASRFMYALVDWLAAQSGSPTSTTTGGGGPAQRTLSHVLKHAKMMEDPLQRDLALHVLRHVPQLFSSFWSRFPTSLDPRLSSRWISSITFATQAVALPLPATLPPRAVLADVFRAPSITRAWYSKALLNSSPLVRYLASLFLLATLQKATHILARLESTGGSGVERFREITRAAIPDGQTIVGMLQRAREQGHAGNMLENVTLRLLWAYHRAVPDVIESLRFDWSKLLSSSASTSMSETQDRAMAAMSQANALRMAAAHCGTLGWTRPAEHFKASIEPLFALHRAHALSPSNRKLLADVLRRVLRSPALFEQDADEVDAWIDTVNTQEDEAAWAWFEGVVREALQDRKDPLSVAVESDKTPARLLQLLFLKLLASDKEGERAIQLHELLVAKDHGVQGFTTNCLKVLGALSLDTLSVDSADESLYPDPLKQNAFSLSPDSRARMPVELAVLHLAAADSESVTQAEVAHLVAVQDVPAALVVALHGLREQTARHSIVALERLVFALVGVCRQDPDRRFLLSTVGLLETWERVKTPGASLHASWAQPADERPRSVGGVGVACAGADIARASAPVRRRTPCRQQGGRGRRASIRRRARLGRPGPVPRSIAWSRDERD